MLNCSFSVHLSRFLHCLFFFNDTATTEIYTLSLHDALPIFVARRCRRQAARRRPDGDVSCRRRAPCRACCCGRPHQRFQDRKSTRLNSSHTVISYAVFCLKKKKQQTKIKSLRTI